MSIIAKNYQEIVEESLSMQKKKIQKTKRRNQYTIDFKFGSNLNIEKLKNILQVKINIPSQISNKQVIRLQSNIQFPLELNEDVKLGSLSIDPHSFNHKIIRIDKKENQTIFTLEAMDNPFTPFDQFFENLKQRNPRLAKSFEQFNHRNLDVNTYKQTQEQIINDFETQLNKPFTCYLFRLKNGVCQTIQRIVNDQFMDLLGISQQMLEDYVLKTNILPFSTYIDPNDDVSEIISGLFEGNLLQDIRTREVMNYNGQIFSIRVQNKSFFTYNSDEDAYYEYSYYIYDCDSRWISKQRVQRNSAEYFNEIYYSNKKQRTRLSSEDSQSTFQFKQCGYKFI